MSSQSWKEENSSAKFSKNWDLIPDWRVDVWVHEKIEAKYRKMFRMFKTTAALSR